ncbi:cytochrome b-c1 complex subunit 9 [Danaus plexippus]|uniref:cytochrome b-c1 complex subunit 9 n=1 Tax=Danaus plexippus TaxID=13037 RepID=UPI0013C47E49|nr:cytochrome b-c1 complex subunit 9 [Danaus plexippus]
MSLWATLNRNVFKKTSTFAVAVTGGAFFFERAFEVISVSIFESVNKGKLWKDIKHKYE